MNFPQADCPEGYGKDVWFRIVTNVSEIPCESKVAYVVIPVLVSVLASLILFGMVLAFVLSRGAAWSIRIHFVLCACYLATLLITIWLGMGSVEFASGVNGSSPITLFATTMIGWCIELTVHYHEMQRFGSRLLGDQRRAPSGFFSGLQTLLGSNTWVDHLLINICKVSMACFAIVFWILVPISPSPLIEWYMPGGLIYQKDFFVSLGFWIFGVWAIAMVSTSLLTLWKIRAYLMEHLVARGRADDQHDSRGWTKQLTRLRMKIDAIICFSCVAFAGGFGFLLCMSLNYVLGLRWWAIVILLVVTLGMSTFLLSIHFPTAELRRKFSPGSYTESHKSLSVHKSKQIIAIDDVT